MDSKTVWVIEQGEYSDYRVVGVFSSEANAKLVADAINKDSYSDWSKARIAEWPLDPAAAEINQGMEQYRIQMLIDGTTESVEKRTSMYDISDEFNIYRVAPNSKESVLDATVWATDETHAVKIVNERRAQLIAANQWDAV